MRIIAGECGGMRLLVPKGKGTRPMPDRVRESMFSSLGSDFGTAAMLPEINVLDFFAGTGSFGLEAVSRGAKLCCFVEKVGRALSVLRQNIKNLGLEGRCWIVNGDAFVCKVPKPPDGEGWQLVFLDPPYALAESQGDMHSVPELLASLSESDVLADDALVVLRHTLQVDYERRIGHLIPEQIRVYGTMKFTWFRYARQIP